MDQVETINRIKKGKLLRVNGKKSGKIHFCDFYGVDVWITNFPEIKLTLENSFQQKVKNRKVSKKLYSIYNFTFERCPYFWKSKSQILYIATGQNQKDYNLVQFRSSNNVGYKEERREWESWCDTRDTFHFHHFLYRTASCMIKYKYNLLSFYLG